MAKFDSPEKVRAVLEALKKGDRSTLPSFSELNDPAVRSLAQAAFDNLGRESLEGLLTQLQNDVLEANGGLPASPRRLGQESARAEAQRAVEQYMTWEERRAAYGLPPVGAEWGQSPLSALSSEEQRIAAARRRELLWTPPWEWDEYDKSLPPPAARERDPMSKILAELVYEFGGKRWAAEVTKGKDPATGAPAFVLTIESGGYRSVAGSFTHGKALVKYLHDKTDDKFKGYAPTKDTLRAIADRAPASLVPDCYLSGTAPEGTVGRGYPECPNCPYKSGCGEQAAAPTAPVSDLDALSADEKRKRLRALVAAKWGNAEE